MSNFNFSTTGGATPHHNATPEPLWSFHGVKSFPGPAGTVVLYKRDGDRRMMVQPDVAQALTLCSPFRSLAAHTQTVIAALPALAEHKDHTEQILAQIAEAGLFERSEAAWNRLTQESTTEPSESVRIFILTCDRPAALERLLESLQQSGLPAEAQGLWVIDDSREDANRVKNAALITAAHGTLDAPLHHVNDDFKKALVQHIVATTPGTDAALSWLLSREHWRGAATYGIARNLSLLLSVGHRALVLDDDVIAQAIAPPLSETPLKAGTANDRESVFYANREELDRHALATPDSPLTMMLKHLGKPIGQILREKLHSHRELAGWNGSLLSHHSTSSRTLLNQCGSWGDAGTGGAQGVVYLGEACIKRLMDSSEPLEAVFGAQASWLGYRGPMLTQHGTMSQLTGLDHRALLPPYLPAGRGEDILFGIMLQRLHPESVVHNEGWAIRHAPLDERPARGILSPLTANAGINLLADWLGREPADQWGLTPERRLLGLAEQVARLSEMDGPALEAMAGEELVAKRTNLLNRCMRHLSQLRPLEDLPRTNEWRAFLESSRDQLVADIQAPEGDALAAAAGKLGSDGIDQMRRHGASFAQAMTLWPQICEAAREFKP